MKYPAVAFIRCRIDKSEKIELRGVYLVASNTAIVETEDGLLSTRPYEAKLMGFIKIESPDDYDARKVKEEKSSSSHKIDGSSIYDEVDLKINAIQTVMSFTGPNHEVKKLKDAFNREQRKIPDEVVNARNEAAAKKTDPTSSESNIPIENHDTPMSYSITRFHISGNTKEQNIKNFFKGVMTNVPTGFIGLTAASLAAKLAAKTVFSGGGKRRNMKYTMNNPKNRNKRNTKKYKK